MQPIANVMQTFLNDFIFKQPIFNAAINNSATRMGWAEVGRECYHGKQKTEKYKHKVNLITLWYKFVKTKFISFIKSSSFMRNCYVSNLKKII